MSVLNRGSSSGSSDGLFKIVAALREVPTACFKPWRVFGKFRWPVSNRGSSSGSSDGLFQIVAALFFCSMLNLELHSLHSLTLGAPTSHKPSWP